MKVISWQSVPRVLEMKYGIIKQLKVPHKVEDFNKKYEVKGVKRKQGQRFATLSW